MRHLGIALTALLLTAPELAAARPKANVAVSSARRAPRPDALAMSVLAALASKSGAVLARAAHPKKGVRFSTYGAVSTGDVRLVPSALRNAFRDPRQRVWGNYDGSGEAMKLSFAGFRDFLWQCDYQKAPHVRANPKAPPEESGNLGGNSAAWYQGAEVREYYCPSDESRMWSSLSLAFEREHGQWYLVGVVSDGWTI